MVSSSWDSTLKLWDAKNGTELATLKGHKGFVEACAFSFDNSKIVSASSDRTLKVWNTETVAVLATFTGHRDIIRSCAFSSDNSKIISASWDNSVKIWNIDAGIEMKLASFTAHKNGITSCLFSPDNRIILTASDDQYLKLWDAQTCSEIAILEGHVSEILCCAYSSDGSKIASGSWDERLKLWDSKTGAELITLTAGNGPIHCCAFSPDGYKIAFGGTSLWLCDTETGVCLATLKGAGHVSACAFTADGRRIVSYYNINNQNEIKFWDSENYKEIYTFKGHCLSEIFPDGYKIVYRDYNSRDGYKKLVIGDVETGVVLSTMIGHRKEIDTCKVSPDCRSMVSGSRDNTLKIWDVKTGAELATLNGHNKDVLSCAYSSDSSTIVSASIDKMLKIWDVQTGKEITSFFCERALCFSVSGDGQMIACGDGAGNIYLLKPEGFKIMQGSARITPVRLWHGGDHKSTGAFAENITVQCPYCGSVFVMPQDILDTIIAINRDSRIGPDDSPCLKLPKEAWEEPRLLSECPNCKKPLRFNPFVVDNKNR
jgi:WD40 repeat protein